MIDVKKLNDVFLMQGDCFEKMKSIPDHSVDLILCDPPYNLAKYKYISLRR